MTGQGQKKEEIVTDTEIGTEIDTGLLEGTFI